MNDPRRFKSMLKLYLLALTLILGGCQTEPMVTQMPVSSGVPNWLQVHAPEAWGGEVRCSPLVCRLAVVEHEVNAVVLHELQGRTTKAIGRHSVAYHPDAARWISADLVVAAVEGASGIDVFRVINGQLTRIQQISIGFAPRDVMLIKRDGDRYVLLATPYSGEKVAWIDWVDGNVAATQVHAQRWCRTPWHPRLVPSGPNGAGHGLIVACLDDQVIAFIPGATSTSDPITVARFTQVPRHVVPSPSGKWWFVALETGGKNARVNAATGDVQWLAAPTWGGVSAAPLSDDLVVWGEDQRVYLQQYKPDGEVIETRMLKASGFPTGLQLIDADLDGLTDLVIYNSAGDHVDVHYGPLWDRASPFATKP